MSLFGKIQHGAQNAWDNNVGGAKTALSRGTPRFYGSTMQWGNMPIDTGDPEMYAALAGVGEGGTMGPLATVSYLGRQREKTRQNRALDKQYGPQADAAAMLARQQAISAGLGGGGAGFMTEQQAYDDVMRQRAEASYLLEQQTQQNQLAGLSSLASLGGYSGNYGGF